VSGIRAYVARPLSRAPREEAPGAYKDVSEVVDAADHAGLARRVARLEPLVCVKGSHGIVTPW